MGEAKPFLKGGSEQEQARQSVVFLSISAGMLERLLGLPLNMLQIVFAG